MSINAAAQIVTITRAHEVAVSNLRLPGTPAGTIAFKEDCSTCEWHTVRVTPATQYILNGELLSLNKFDDAIKSIPEKDTAISTVMHHLESDTVVEVNLATN